jgi:hypothetical protein
MLANRQTFLDRFEGIIAPLNKGVLLGKKSTAQDEALLEELLRSGDLVNLATHGSPCAFVTKEQAASEFSPVNVAQKALLKHLEGGSLANDSNLRDYEWPSARSLC